MPRDGSGNYALPAENPVVDGTIITSSWANGTMADIATQLNNVLTRDGVLGATNPFKLVDGTAALPGLTFTSQANLGLYRPTTNTLGITAAGAQVASFSNTGITLLKPLTGVGGVLASTNPFSAPAGTVALPGYTFTGTEDTGLYRPNTATFAATVDGVETMRWGSAQVLLADGTAALPLLTFLADPNTGLYRIGADILGFATGGTEKLRLGSTSQLQGNFVVTRTDDAPTIIDLLAPVNRAAQVRMAGNGNAVGTEGFHVYQGPTSAVLNNMIDQPIIAYITSIEKLRVDSNEVKATVPVVVPNGTAALPALTFAGDAQRDTGIWWPGSDTLGFSTGGEEHMRLTTGILTVKTLQDTNMLLDVTAPVGRIAWLRLAGNGNAVGVNSFNIYQGAGGASINNMINEPIAFYIAGTEVMRITSTAVRYLQPIQQTDGTAPLPSYTFTSDPNTGIYSIGADILGIAAGGAERFRISQVNAQFAVPTLAADGTAAAPSISFLNAQNAGLWRSAGQVSMSFGGVEVMRWTAAGILGLIPLLASNGTAAAPSVSFFGDTNTGFYSAGVDSIGMALNGLERMKAINIAANLDTQWSHNAGSVTMGLQSALNFTTSIYAKHNALSRWTMNMGDATAETGANTGANYSLTCHNDAGGILFTPISIVRATGIVTVKTTFNDIKIADAAGVEVGTLKTFIDVLEARLAAVEALV